MFSAKENINTDPEKLRGSKLLKKFVAQHRGRWTYDDFLKLSDALKKKRHDIGQEALLQLLEEERQIYLKTLMGDREDTKPGLAEAPLLLPVSQKPAGAQPLNPPLQNVQPASQQQSKPGGIMAMFKKSEESEAKKNEEEKRLALYRQAEESLRKSLAELARQKEATLKEIDELRKKRDELELGIVKKNNELIGESREIDEEKVKLKRVEDELQHMRKRLEGRENIYAGMLHKIKLKEKHLDTMEKNLNLRENDLQLREKKLLMDHDRLTKLEQGFRKEKQALLQEVFEIEKKKNSLYTEIKELENLRERIEEEINHKREELVSRFRTNIETQKDLEIRKMETETKEAELKMKQEILDRRAKEIENQARLVEMEKKDFSKVVGAPEKYKDEDVKMVVRELELREEELNDKERMLVEKEKMVLEKIRELNKKALEMYTKELVKQGVEKEHITAKLIDAGWDMQHIKEHLEGK